MRYVVASFFAFAAICLATPAYAEKRVALIIGNSTYQNSAELKNPGHDAADMAGLLTRLGFEVVEGRDLDKRAMERTIRQFSIKLAGADVALFFYAGHGLQVDGRNHLIPIDARLANVNDVDFETVPLALVLKQMEREAKTSLLLLDACRDNPLARNLARTMGTRGQIGEGLAEVKTGIGTLIGFSTQPGNVALDGAGRNSPYAEALLKHIAAPRTDIGTALVAVRNDVLKVTFGRQVPWEHTSLTGQVYLHQGEPPTTLATVPAAPPPWSPVSSDKEMEMALWNSVKDSKSAPVLQTYLDRFPNGTFARLAKVMIEEMNKEAAARESPPAPKVTSAPIPPAPKSAERALADPAKLARELQNELKRVGCDPGAADGIWGKKAQSALQKFASRTKLTFTLGEPTPAALEAVSAQKGRICTLECDDDEKEVKGKCVPKAPVRQQTASRRTRSETRARYEESREREPREREPSVGGPTGGTVFIGRRRGGAGFGIRF